jgi:uncharacterized protein YndB with AHSA1/START domain
MPITCTVSGQINAPAAAVFAAATDIPSFPQRITGIKKVEVHTAGPMAKGTRFSETRVMFGKEATATMEIIDFQPGRSYTTLSTQGGCEYRMIVSVRPIGGGGTGGGSELRFDFSGKPLTFLTKLMSPLQSLTVKTVGAKALRKDITDMKAALEKNATQ